MDMKNKTRKYNLNLNANDILYQFVSINENKMQEFRDERATNFIF